MIRFMALDEVIGDDQDRMADSHDGFLLADARGQAMILSRQVGAFAAGGGVSGLVEQDTQRTIAAPRPAGAPFAGTFVVARGNPGPGSKVTGRFKAAHIEANLRDN